MKFNFKYIIHISTLIILITKLRPKYLQYLFCPKSINLSNRKPRSIWQIYYKIKQIFNFITKVNDNKCVFKYDIS